MSKRHRDSRVQVLPPEERRRERRRLRHETRLLLSAADPDDVALPKPVHSRPHAPPVSDDVSDNRFRVWKTPFWKRRTAMRHERNVMLSSLANEGW